MLGSTRAHLLLLVGALAVLSVAGYCTIQQPGWEVGVGSRVRLSARLRIPPEFSLDSGQPGLGPFGWPGIRLHIGRSVIGFGVTDYGHTGYRRDEHGFYLEGLTTIGHTFTEDQTLSGHWAVGEERGPCLLGRGIVVANRRLVAPSVGRYRSGHLHAVMVAGSCRDPALLPDQGHSQEARDWTDCLHLPAWFTALRTTGDRSAESLTNPRDGTETQSTTRRGDRKNPDSCGMGYVSPDFGPERSYVLCSRNSPWSRVTPLLLFRSALCYRHHHQQHQPRD